MFTRIDFLLLITNRMLLVPDHLPYEKGKRRLHMIGHIVGAPINHRFNRHVYVKRGGVLEPGGSPGVMAGLSMSGTNDIQ